MRAGNWIALFALVASGMGPVNASAETCDFRKDRNGGEDAAGVAKIVIRAGAGDLKVHGIAGGRRIDAKGVACAGNQALLDQSQVSVRREGNVVYVETKLPQDGDQVSWGNHDYAYIDLGVTLPDNI